MTEGNTDLSVKLGRLKLNNPVIACSGTFSYGNEHNEFYKIRKLGAVTTKSYSLEPREGNAPPRIFETQGGILNSIGLQNDGIEVFISKHLPRIKEMDARVILSIFGGTLKEFTDIVKKIKTVEEGIAAIELNLSCPNIKKSGESFCSSPLDVEKVVARINKISGLPIIAKLSPNHENLIDAAKAAKRGGADAVSLINTVIGTAVDIETSKPRLGNILGGLSGPAVKPIALAKVYSLSKENILPIIGMGGIFNWKDVLEFMIMGAAAVGIGTVNFVQHDAGIKILEGLAGYLEEKNISSISSLTGSLKV